MKCRAFLITVCLSVAAVGACSSPETRPEGLSECNDDVCVGVRGDTPIDINLTQDGQGGSADQLGAGSGGALMGRTGAGVLQGSVSVVTEPDLTLSASPSIALQLLAAGSGITALSTEVNTDGSFRLDGVPDVRPLWVSIGEERRSATSLYMDTFQPVPVDTSRAVQLRVVQRSVVNDLASQSFQSDQITIDPEAAHAVLSIVTAEGAPIEGAVLTNSDLTLAYDAGDIYSDVLSQTSSRGTVVILNIPAEPYPGKPLTMVFDVAGEEYEFEIYLAQGSISLATLELAP